ncbi:TPR end-of-group domain-containing protein [Colwellia psychrerythraea]|uniref:Uncharacterized protein n=1 Tax=Colwellia psychrerythraea TaxID=28229 RepID=A0A099KY35_COLPS|nr:hypothetical protein [Colwellia psychrerythraea]KGJ94797.1 hypothetical protein GAB14E_2031 [Colwellia psychrerythraea]
MKIKEIRTDGLIMFSFLTIIALVLLFPLGYWVGNAGFVAMSILLSIAVYFAFTWAKAIGRSFANGAGNTSRNEREAMIIALICFGYFAYLSLGLHYLIIYLNTGITLQPFFYIWVTSFSAPMLFLALLASYKAYPVLTIIRDLKQLYQQKLQLKNQQKEQNAYELSVVELNNKYKLAIDAEPEVYSYIKLSEITAKQYKNKGSLPLFFANYATKLMIKYTKTANHNVALTVFNSYVDVIVPYVGLSEKSSDVASIAIYISVRLDNPKLFNKTTEHILGKNMNVLEVDNNVLHFNLACYYALKQDKAKLLLFVSLARRQGKSTEAFLNDNDFNYYLNDPEFMKLVNSP